MRLIGLLAIILLSVAGLTSCGNEPSENQWLQFFSPDHDLTAGDLKRMGFSEAEPGMRGWLVNGEGNTTVHFFLDDSNNILYQMTDIQKVQSISQADSLIESHGGDPILWMDAFKQDSIHLKKVGFVSSRNNGILFYAEYNEKTKGLVIYHDFPNHFNPAKSVWRKYDEYELKCSGD